MEAATTELVVPEEERELRGLELAERHFPPERRAQVASFLEVPPDAPALLPYLAWCASLNLSPIAGHVWLIPKKLKARDGNPERTIYKPAIGRDGLLHKARESKGKRNGYKGMQFAVVCEKDTFEVEYTGDLDTDPKVLHRFASKPSAFEEGESPDRYRGKVIGAWAKCYVDGEPPTFYFANLREHGQLQQVWDYSPQARQRVRVWLDANGQRTFEEFDENGMHHRPCQEWAGAWEYLSTMILKAAQSYVLRIALGVTGVVPVDELRGGAEAFSAADGSGAGAGVEAPESLAPEFDFAKVTDDEQLAARLKAAVDRSNEQEPFSWGPARVEMVMSGRSADELAVLATQIERENDIRHERAEKAAAARAEHEAEVVDAEVVDEPVRADEEPAGGDEHKGAPVSAAALEPGDRVEFDDGTVRVLSKKEVQGDVVKLDFAAGEGEEAGPKIEAAKADPFTVVQG